MGCAGVKMLNTIHEYMYIYNIMNSRLGFLVEGGDGDSGAIGAPIYM